MQTKNIAVYTPDPDVAERIRSLYSNREVNVKFFANPDLYEQSFYVEPYNLAIVDITADRVKTLRMLKRLLKVIEIPYLALDRDYCNDHAIDALEVGATIYLNLMSTDVELKARIFALERPRETRQQKLNNYHASLLKVDSLNNTVILGEKEFRFTSNEIKIIQGLFAELINNNGCLTKQELLQIIWKEQINHDKNIINVYLHSIRKKFSAAGFHDIIVNIARKGYKLELTNNSIHL